MAKGSLLVMSECLETADIAEIERNEAVCSFYEMKSEAERQGNRFYALSTLFSHHFTYGEFYPAFINMSWPEFRECKTLKGINQISFEMMRAFCMNPNINILETKEEFLAKEQPQTTSGYQNANDDEYFVNTMTDLENWQIWWYRTHNEFIDWTGANAWFPRLDLILRLLRRELIDLLGQEYADTITDCNLVNVFYEKVMKHKGTEIEAYASKIGEEVCLCNYYKFETELSTMEQQQCHSLRKIFSIINYAGRVQFVSIDFRHGMFEFHDEYGRHLGEYRFDGSLNSGAAADHNLCSIERWRRKCQK